MLGHSPRPLKSYPGEDALALPPLQLGPEDREELLLREAHEADPGGGLDHLHRVVLPEAHPDLAVHGDHDVLVRHERDLDPVHAGEDDRPVRQGVGADRRQHDRVHGREQDRPAGREVVGGRARGCRDDEAVGTVRGGVLSLDGHREVDDATHRGLGDDDVVEGGVLPEPLAVPDDARGQHHALVHRHPACEQRLERREHLLERRRGEEAEPAEVHAEEGYPQIADSARHGEEGPVAAEHDEQVHLRRQVRLAHGRDARRRDQPGGLLLQERGEPPRLEPLEEFLDRGPGLARAGLRHDADALHASASTLRSIMDSRSLAVRPWLEQWRKNSRLPFGPRSGEAVTPSTCQPRSTAYRARRATPRRGSAGARPTPPLPTAPRPPPKSGFTRAPTPPPAAGHLHLEGVERVGELLAAPAHERRTPLDLDARLPGDEGARLVDALAVHEHLARQDEADGLLPALDEPALDEHTVDTHARHGLGHALHYRRPPRRDRIRNSRTIPAGNPPMWANHAIPPASTRPCADARTGIRPLGSWT